MEHQEHVASPPADISCGKALTTSGILLQHRGAAWLLQGCCSWKLLACGRRSTCVKGDLIINKHQGMIQPRADAGGADTDAVKLISWKNTISSVISASHLLPHRVKQGTQRAQSSVLPPGFQGMDESSAGKMFSIHIQGSSLRFKICHWKPQDTEKEAKGTAPSPLVSAFLKLLPSDACRCVGHTLSTHAQETPECAVNESSVHHPRALRDTGCGSLAKQSLLEVSISS